MMMQSCGWNLLLLHGLSVIYYRIEWSNLCAFIVLIHVYVLFSTALS